jgi:hypothetical protein
MNRTPRTLHHVTLNSGHVRANSPRSEVRASTIDRLLPIMDAALDPDMTAVVPLTGGRFRLSASCGGETLLVVLLGMVAGQWIPVMMMGVSPETSEDAAGLWLLLHAEGADLSTHPDSVPPSPWCAVRMLPGALLFPKVMRELGDFERCIAWTWIEMLEPAST